MAINIHKIIPLLITFIIIIGLFYGFQTFVEKNEKIPIKDNKAKILFVGLSNDSYFKTIQDAINASSDSDTIIVENGTYNEQLTINKSINIIGSSINQTIIEYISDNTTNQISIINITSDKCKIQNLTVTKNINTSVSTDDTIAIFIDSSNNTIKDNIITNVSKGISLGRNTKNNIIINNQISNNLIAINLFRSFYNKIENNFITLNTNNGIYLHTKSNENTIKNNILLHNFYGVMIKGSNKNKLYDNCLKENNYGVYCCCGSLYNIIYNNIFINNTVHNGNQNEDLENYWYNYPNVGGNYWDDYSGYDGNQDGYGDTSYIIPEAGKQDKYPLINPPEDITCNR